MLPPPTDIQKIHIVLTHEAVLTTGIRQGVFRLKFFILFLIEFISDSVLSDGSGCLYITTLSSFSQSISQSILCLVA